MSNIAPRCTSKAIRIFPAMALASWVIGPAVAQEIMALRGEAFIAGQQLVDPAPKDPKNSHVYFTVKGVTALQIYRTIEAREEDDLCRGEGWRLKRVGALSCSLTPRRRDAICNFSLDLRNGSAAGGKPC